MRRPGVVRAAIASGRRASIRRSTRPQKQFVDAPPSSRPNSALEREAFFDLCAKYRPMIRLMYDATDEEKARWSC